MQRLHAEGRIVFETELVAKDGRHIPVEISSRLFELQGTPAMLAMVRDISERKQAEQELRESQERFATVADFTWDWETWRGVDGALIYSSPSCERITGHAAEEFLSDPQLLVEIAHPDDRAVLEAHYRNRLSRGDTGCHLEFRIITKSGETRWIGHECQRVFNRDGELLGVRGSNRDITPQREAVDRLRQSEELFRGLFDTMTSGCAIYEVRGDGGRGADYVVKDCNMASLRLEGKTKKEVVGKSLANLRPAIDDYGLIPVFQRVWETGEPSFFPAKRYVDGRFDNWYESQVFRLSSGEIASISHDVTERELAQQALAEKTEETERQHQLLETLLDTIPSPVFYKDTEGRYLGCNKAFETLLGVPRERVIGKGVYELSPASLAARYEETDRELFEHPGTQTYEWRVKSADGTERDVIYNKATFAAPDSSVAGLVGVMQDITERRRAEEALCTNEAILATAERVAHVGSWRFDLASGKATWSDEMFRLFGWDQADFDGDIWRVLDARVHPDDLPTLRETLTKAIAAAEPVPVEHRLVLPDGTERIMCGEGSVERDEAGRAVALVGYYQDVTERRAAVERLGEMLKATVRALGAVGTLRDPYTGDHERRVAELADAIAAQMELDPNRREGLRMAADVHDVGKVGVPAEIFSKPARLSDVEQRLVQQHPTRGQEILADIPFQWPVAEIVHQHHERLDGSGYPRGLREGEILLEARILAVADVVEAMASHRPYRPALGLDAALAEIRDGAGGRYDADVVAACERVLKAGIVRLDP
jgi:PAS domain S-box-containing protein